MKEIKTIVFRLDNAGGFDTAVNQAIKEGWTLIERKVLTPQAQPSVGNIYHNRMLYAELERFTEPDEAEDNPVSNLIENVADYVRMMNVKLAHKQRGATAATATAPSWTDTWPPSGST